MTVCRRAQRGRTFALDVSYAVFSASTLSLRSDARRAGRHYLACDGMSAAGNRPSMASFGSCVRAGPLAPHRQPTAVPHATVASDIYQATDVHVHLASEVAFDRLLAVDDLPKAVQLSVGQVSDTGIAVDARPFAHVARLIRADAVDAPQGDLDPLVIRDVDSGDDGQSFLLSGARFPR